MLVTAALLTACSSGEHKESGTATALPVTTTTVHPDDRSLLQPGGAISISGRTFTYEDLDKIQASTTVAAEFPLLFNPTASPSRRARNQLQYIVNRLGRPPGPNKVDMLSVSASRDADGGVSQLVLLRNGTAGLIKEVHVHEIIRTGGKRGPVLADSNFKFAASVGDPPIPAGGSYAAMLKFNPGDVKDRTTDIEGATIDYEVDAEWR